MHNHFRPGGVRRVIELATPQLVRGLNPRPGRVILASGEEPGAAWLQQFKASLQPVPVLIRAERTLAYVSEQSGRRRHLAMRIRRFLERLLADGESGGSLVWAHNLGLGRNILLTAQLQRVCAERRVHLVSHHHDWWFDNRWARWPEMRGVGVRSLAAAAEVVFAVASPVQHVAINHADASVLKKHFGAQSGWLPNPANSRTKTSKAALGHARQWLQEALGERRPVWLMPCRLLRRKNIAEALLLTRWLRPEACLVTTGGVTSPDEQAYCDRLGAVARENHWPLGLALLEDRRDTGKAARDSRLPSIHELLAASEAVLLTSLQEGFGLAYLEAAAAGRPLIARGLGNIMPDLARFGFHFPQSYNQLLVHPSLFDWDAELRRQTRLFSAWRNQIPRACHNLVGKPWLLRGGSRPCAIPFNRLTLTAQLEVLSAPLETSWALCAPLNPFLTKWRNLAGHAALKITRWPRQADRWLGGPAYAQRFQRILSARPPNSDAKQPGPEAAVAAQEELMRQKLATDNLYPLLWSPAT